MPGRPTPEQSARSTSTTSGRKSRKRRTNADDVELTEDTACKTARNHQENYGGSSNSIPPIINASPAAWVPVPDSATLPSTSQHYPTCIPGISLAREKQGHANDNVPMSAPPRLLSRYSDQQGSTNALGQHFSRQSSKSSIITLSSCTTATMGAQAMVGAGGSRASTTPPHLERLQKALDMGKFTQQLERLIEQPIKIPGTLSMCPPGQHSTRTAAAESRHAPGKAKRDLLSVDDVWESEEEKRRALTTLYNTSSVGEERKWLLDMLLEESDADSGGEEQFTEEDLQELLRIHQKSRKLQKAYHGNPLNAQYTYYSAGLLSEVDRFPENQARLREDITANGGRTKPSHANKSKPKKSAT